MAGVQALIGAVSGVAAGAGLVWTYLDRRRWTIRYGIDQPLPLMQEPAPAGIEITYNGEVVHDPHVASLIIAVRAPRAITPERFHGGEPIQFTFDVDIVGVWPVRRQPASPALPPIALPDEKTLELRPGLLHRRHRIELRLLTKGPRISDQSV